MMCKRWVSVCVVLLVGVMCGSVTLAQDMGVVDRKAPEDFIDKESSGDDSGDSREEPRFDYGVGEEDVVSPDVPEEEDITEEDIAEEDITEEDITEDVRVFVPRDGGDDEGEEEEPAILKDESAGCSQVPSQSPSGLPWGSGVMFGFLFWRVLKRQGV